MILIAPDGHGDRAARDRHRRFSGIDVVADRDGDEAICGAVSSGIAPLLRSVVIVRSSMAGR